MHSAVNFGKEQQYLSSSAGAKMAAVVRPCLLCIPEIGAARMTNIQQRQSVIEQKNKRKFISFM